MRGDTSMSLQRERGFRAESRFIYLANQPPARRSYAPRGFVRIEHAPPIMDVRGVDAFVIHYRGGHSTAHKRIPIQLKHGPNARTSYYTTHCGMNIPVVATSLDITQGNVFERIRMLLDYHELYARHYDERKLHALEHNAPTHGELEVVDLIRRSRAAFAYTPAPETSEQVQMA